MECLHCGKKLSVIRKLRDQEFCSAAHRKAYVKKQDAQVLDFLFVPPGASAAAPPPQPLAELVASEAQTSETEPPTEEPAAREPDLVLAPFAAESVSASHSTARRTSSAQPLLAAPAGVLPA